MQKLILQSSFSLKVINNFEKKDWQIFIVSLRQQFDEIVLNITFFVFSLMTSFSNMLFSIQLLSKNELFQIDLVTRDRYMTLNLY